MKRLLTILFAFMMVLTTTTMVFAEEGSTPGTKGKITINQAIDEETYSIYRIFELESFYKDTTDDSKSRYAYKPTTEWEAFVLTGDGQGYFEKDKDGYITWKHGTDESKKAEFAQKALKFARETSGLTKQSKKKEAGVTLEFPNLELGYYLVDSGVGALCSLDTTNTSVTIQEKNSKPEVTKKVSTTAGGTYDEKVSANVGDLVYFQTEITVGKGAQEYALHDKMDEGLEFNYTAGGTSTVSVWNQTKSVAVTHTIETDATALGDGCTFHIKFSNYTEFDAGDKLVIKYSAKVTETAIDKTVGVKNDTWLAYGSGHETTHDDAKVFTFNIPVYKYYDDNGTNTGLANVTFKLYTDADCTDGNEIKLAQQTDKTIYNYDKTSTNVTIKTETAGKFTIKGLAQGTYYLKEISTPNGFNLLKKPVEIIIDENGGVTYKEKGSTATATNITATENLVKIENKTGVVLPSTGGAGTTMMYIVGAMLLIGSGVVLITKKNVK